MDLINILLNLAGLLLWLHWRALSLATEKSSPLSLASTVKRAEPLRRATRWVPLLSLGLLLGGRSLLYWNIGPAANWTPFVHLGAISLPFRSDHLSSMLAFSLLSFFVLLGGGYAWLLLLSVVNRRVSNEDPFQKFVRQQLGRVDGWPAAVKFLLPLTVAILLWGLASPVLVDLGIVPSPASALHRWEQALLLGLTTVLVWKLLVIALCFLYLLTSYVHLGRSRFWTFVQTTGSNLLGPLRRFPLCFGKIDLSPVLGIVVVLLAAHWGSDWLPRIYQRLPF